MSDEFKISFIGTTSAEANRYAGELHDLLRDADRNVRVEQTRENPETQDFGATLVLVLGTASVSAIAKGIQSWLARNSGATIEISQDGTLLARNLDTRDAAKIVEAAFKAKNKT